VTTELSGTTVGKLKGKLTLAVVVTALLLGNYATSAARDRNAAAGVPVAARLRSPSIPPTRIRVVSSTAPVSGGAATLRLSCEKGEAIRLTCRGWLTLSSRPPGRRVRLGRARFAIPNCCSAPAHAVHVTLNTRGRSLTGDAERTPVRAVARLDHGEASGTRTVWLVR
jgi:hypothetical protein